VKQPIRHSMRDVRLCRGWEPLEVLLFLKHSTSLHCNDTIDGGEMRREAFCGDGRRWEIVVSEFCSVDQRNAGGAWICGEGFFLVSVRQGDDSNQM
jgi:hypothetical protein